MSIDGVKRVGTKRVMLDEFFAEPTFVEIRITPPYTRAKVREVMMASFNVDSVDASGKSAGIQTRMEGMADREIKIRDLKLSDCCVATNMKADGANAVWGEALWKELDEANPGILDKVIREIDGFAAGPASPT